MRYKYLVGTLPLLAATIALVCISYGKAQVETADVSEANVDGNAEPMLRGPIHEAFAEPTRPDVEPTIVVPKSPPDPVPEIPPEIKPAGEGVIWIGGYWAWDDERESFIWVSGVWRVVPPDRRWVPGYWHEVAEGYQWVAGFWTETRNEVVEYLPYPPESLERGPTSPAPSDRHYWVSGYWVYRNDDYAWRPGTWAVAHTNWMWQPAHYVWTPRGAVFVHGYWDYPFARRGQLFAPVYFQNQSFRPGYAYSPNVAVNATNLIYHLFVRPSAYHYYWGDFYGPRYSRAGWYNWTDYQSRYGYDPLFSYYRADYSRRGIDFDRQMSSWYRDMARYEDRRPPRTLSEQLAFAARASNDPQLGRLVMANTIANIIEQPRFQDRYQRISREQRQSFGSVAQEVRGLVRQRQQTETRVAAAESATDRRARADAGTRGGAATRAGSEAAGTTTSKPVLRLPKMPDLHLSAKAPKPPAETAVASDAANDTQGGEREKPGRVERAFRAGEAGEEGARRERSERGGVAETDRTPKAAARTKPAPTSKSVPDAPTSDTPGGESAPTVGTDEKRPVAPDRRTTMPRTTRPNSTDRTDDSAQGTTDTPTVGTDEKRPVAPDRRTTMPKATRPNRADKTDDSAQGTTDTPTVGTDEQRPVAPDRRTTMPKATRPNRVDKTDNSARGATDTPTVGTDERRPVAPDRRTTMPRATDRKIRLPDDGSETKTRGAVPKASRSAERSRGRDGTPPALGTAPAGRPAASAPPARGQSPATRSSRSVRTEDTAPGSGRGPTTKEARPNRSRAGDAQRDVRSRGKSQGNTEKRGGGPKNDAGSKKDAGRDN